LYKTTLSVVVLDSGTVSVTTGVSFAAEVFLALALAISEAKADFRQI
jgi:hypothetical protein